MASLRDIRKRIASVKNTQKITNAMKMVAAAKLRRAEEAVTAARPYSDKMRDVLMSLASRTNPSSHELLETGPVTKVLLIQVTADRGLCGGFNANLNRRADAFFREMKGKGAEIGLISVGRKGHDYFRRRQIPIAGRFVNVMNNVTMELAGDIAREATEKFVSTEYQEVYLLYNRFRTAATQILTLRKLLPVSAEDDAEKRREYLYEPSEEELLAVILPKYIQVQIFSG
ncbi:MAG: ATP synthase F1 subunit gamma, partial [Deltaproteobacteria bacterium]